MPNQNNTMLKYLFSVVFKDGTEYHQNQDDKSAIDPEKRSAFFDVAQRLEDVKSFTLNGEGRSYCVNLEDGGFSVNGNTIYLHEEQILAPARLIYWRKHTKQFQQFIDAETGEGMSKPEEIGSTLVYQIGWQSTDKDGKNYQHTINIQ
ncbi:MAG TPA: hypothetical protein VGE62_01155 [Candidatus Paceibacterota bacterium]